MWTVILPVCSLVMLVPLFIARRRASKSGKLADVKRKRNFKEFLIHLFWDLDVVGIILVSLEQSFVPRHFVRRLTPRLPFHSSSHCFPSHFYLSLLPAESRKAGRSLGSESCLPSACFASPRSHSGSSSLHDRRVSPST